MKQAQFEELLHQALCPEIDPADTVVHYSPARKGNTMNIKRIIRYACTAAVLVLLLTTTVFASDGLSIKTLISGSGGTVYKTYQDMSRAMEKAGFSPRTVERFANGYAFSGAEVGETVGYDESDQQRLRYKELHVNYRSAAGNELVLITHEDLEAIPTGSRQPDQTRMIGETEVGYQVDQYKFVPAGYQRTAEDEENLKRPGYYISEGSETVQLTQVAFLQWKQDGICYMIMDSGAKETAENLYSMAQELILNDNRK